MIAPDVVHLCSRNAGLRRCEPANEIARPGQIAPGFVRSHMGNPIVFFEVTCKDASPLATFYSSVFGWKVDRNEAGGYYGVTTGEGIDGMISELPDDMRSTLTVFVAVEDIDATVAQVEAGGGILLFPAMELPNGERVAMINDPAGTTIGLIQQR
jgi:uncharacterized protein